MAQIKTPGSLALPDDRFTRAGDDANINGTCLRGYFEASYADLVAVFGEPERGDGYKVSTEWIIVDRTCDDVVTVYDWKETSLYESYLMSLDEFRAQKTYQWHLGGRGNVSAHTFAEWLGVKLGKYIPSRNA